MIKISACKSAIKEMLEEKPQPEDWFQFYCDTTLAEFKPKEKSKMAVPPQMPTPPPMPKFNAQNVKLNQMQGFNPLQAANQMGLGSINAINQQPQMATMPVGKGGIFLRAVGAVLGAIVFRLVYTLALRLDMPAFMLKFVSAVIVVLAICVPYLKSQWPTIKRRMAGKAGK